MEAISLIPGVGSVSLALFWMKTELGDTLKGLQLSALVI